MAQKRKVVAKKIAKKQRVAHRAAKKARTTRSDPDLASDTANEPGPSSGGSRTAQVEDEDEEHDERGSNSDGAEDSPGPTRRTPEPAQSDEEEPESAEDEFARLSREWTAPIYAFFDPTPAIRTHKGRRCHEFKCARPGCKKPPVRRYLDTGDAKSTGSLHKHAGCCWGAEVLKMARRCKSADAARPHVVTAGRNGLITDAFKRLAGSPKTYSSRPPTKAQIRINFVCWVAESLRPFLTVKDRGFVELMKTGRPYDHWLPSPNTIANDLMVVWAAVRQRIVEMLAEYDCEVNFATNAWTSPNHQAFVAFIGQIERDGKPLPFLLDILEVPELHTGETLAREFKGVLQDFNISDKMLGVAGDNTSNVDRMVTELEAVVEGFRGAHNRVRCFLHILNLVARVILVQCGDGDGSNGDVDELGGALQDLLDGLEEDEDDDDQERESETEVDEPVDDEEDEGEDNELEDSVVADIVASMLGDGEELKAGLKPLRQLQKKLRKLSVAIINSSTILLPRWKKILRLLELPVRMMPRYCSTRWNSAFKMIEFAYRYREAIDKFTEARENGMRELELSKEEWAMVKELWDVLKVFYDATQLFSRAHVVNITNVIPVIDRLDDFLTTQATDPSRQAAIRAACSLAKKGLGFRV